MLRDAARAATGQEAPRVTARRVGLAAGYVAGSSALGLGLFTLFVLLDEGAKALTFPIAVWTADPLADMAFVAGSLLVGALALRTARDGRYLTSAITGFAGSWLVYTTSFMLLPPGVGLWEPTLGVWPDGAGPEAWVDGFLITLMYGWVGLTFAALAPVMHAWRRPEADPMRRLPTGAIVVPPQPSAADRAVAAVAVVAFATAAVLVATMAAYAAQGEPVTWLFQNKPATCAEASPGSEGVCTNLSSYSHSGAALRWSTLALTAVLAGGAGATARRGGEGALLPVAAFLTAALLGGRIVAGSTPIAGVALVGLGLAGLLAVDHARLKRATERVVVLGEMGCDAGHLETGTADSSPLRGDRHFGP